jgi:hypothetical protein
VLAVLTPLLLQRAWSSEPVARAQAEPGRFAHLWHSRVAWVIVLAGVLSHPVSMLVGYSGSGLPDEFPSFSRVAGCEPAPMLGEQVRVVVGYADSYPEANAMRNRAGLRQTEVAQDGCGRLRVFVDDVPTSAASESVSADARAAGFEPTIERDPDG